MLNLIVITVVLLATSGWSERLHNQIYSSIEGGSACFRRLNGTHQAGCGSSSESGATGAVHWILGPEDASWVAGGGGGGAPYVAVVSTEFFEQVADTLIKRPDNVAGVIVYENDTYYPLHFSSDSHCPNEVSSAPGSRCGSSPNETWNPHGSGLMRRDIPFPLLYLPAARVEEVNALEECYKRFNAWKRDSQAGRALCSVQLSAFMFAAVNSEVCMRRSNAAQLTPTKQCDPVGDRNVHSTLFKRSPEAKETDRSVILVTARIDSASLFDGISPGAASSVVGVVTLLTAASVLSRILPPEKASSYSSNVIWSLLSGESLDYIGSQRVAYDMSRGAWPAEAPLSPRSVALHVGLGQLGGSVAQETAGLWAVTAYTPSYQSPEDEQIKKFLSMLEAAETRIEIITKQTNNLPPSSLHSFRRILGETPAKGGLPELLLVDHGQSFTNQHYQSIFDDKRNVKFVYANVTVDASGKFVDTTTMIAKGHLTENSMQVKISRLANALATVLYRQVTGDVYNGNSSASAHMVDELLYCYLESANCRMFSATEFGPTEGSKKGGLPNEPYPLYSGVHLYNSQVPQTVGMLLALLTGRANTTSFEKCPSDDQEYSYFWLSGWDNSGVCIQSTVNFTDALSPAFIQSDYDWSSGKYSTWTESVWRGIFARMYVAPSGRGAHLAATLGAMATVLIGVFTYWLHKHSNVIFHGPHVSMTINADPSATGILRTVNC